MLTLLEENIAVVKVAAFHNYHALRKIYYNLSNFQIIIWVDKIRP